MTRHLQPHDHIVAILVVNTEQCERTGIDKLIASHGYDLSSGMSFPVPNDHPDHFPDARWCVEMQEYVLVEPSSNA